MLTVTEVAELAGTSRHTVEREIRRGNLSAQRIGRRWAINPWEAGRWAARFRPYAALRGDAASRQAVVI
jgi:excisionase family DNA binding protein